jgi:HEAT repeat protein
MYRGQDIGDRDQLVATCIEILKSGNEAERYKILPHVSVTRCKRFLDPLLGLLGSGTPGDKEFAALGLGALGDPAAIDPLFAVLQDAHIFNKGWNRSLEAAVILTLGEIGHEKAVDLLLQVYDLRYLGEPSAHNRKVNVLSALGLLAQQGSERAVGELLTLAAQEVSDRQAQAVTELSVAYWHRAHQVPDTVLKAMYKMTQAGADEVRRAAVAALSTLANLGCRRAGGYFSAPASG